MDMIRAPRWVVLQITERCNLRCRMCYEWGECGAYLEKKPSEFHDLPLDKIEEVIADLKAYKPHFELFGGEPMMHPQFREIIKMINRHNCLIDIPTNGTLLHRYAEELARSCVNVIWVSIDGPEQYNDLQRGSGVYKLAYEGIKKLKYYKELYQNDRPNIGVTLVITPNNYRVIQEFFCEILDSSLIDLISIEIQLYTTEESKILFKQKLNDKFGIDDTTMADGLVRDIDHFANIDIEELCRQVNYVRDYYKDSHIKVIGYPKDFSKENIKKFYEARWNEMTENKVNCSFPCIYAEIAADGSVTPCHTFYEFKLGNIFHDPIMTIWKNDKYKKVRDVFRKDIFPICYACSRYYS